MRGLDAPWNIDAPKHVWKDARLQEPVLVRVATQIFDFILPATAENPYKSLLFFINPLRTLSFIVQSLQVIIRDLSAKG